MDEQEPAEEMVEAEGLEPAEIVERREDAELLRQWRKMSRRDIPRASRALAAKGRHLVGLRRLIAWLLRACYLF